MATGKGKYTLASAVDYSVNLHSLNNIASAHSFIFDGRYSEASVTPAIDHSMIIHSMQQRTADDALSAVNYSLSLHNSLHGKIDNSIAVLNTSTATDAYSAVNNAITIDVTQLGNVSSNNSVLMSLHGYQANTLSTHLSVKDSVCIGMKGNFSKSLSNSYEFAAFQYATTPYTDTNTIVIGNASYTAPNVSTMQSKNLTNCVYIGTNIRPDDTEDYMQICTVAYNHKLRNLILGAANYISNDATFSNNLHYNTNCLSSISICPGGMWNDTDWANTNTPIHKSIFLKGGSNKYDTIESVIAGNHILKDNLSQSIILNTHYGLSDLVTANSALTYYSKIDTPTARNISDNYNLPNLSRIVSITTSTANMPSAFAVGQSLTYASTLVDSSEAYKQIALLNTTARYEYSPEVQAVTADNRLSIWPLGNNLAKSDLLHVKLQQIKSIEAFSDLEENTVYIITG